jgi:hypothetical protein
MRFDGSAIVAVAMGLAGACSQVTRDDIGQTLPGKGGSLVGSGDSHAGNAFSICDSSRMCDGEQFAGLGCQCAVCTISCADDERCRSAFWPIANSALWEHLTCRAQPLECIDEAMSPAAVGPGVCEVSCDSDADCHAALGSETYCSLRFCRRQDPALRCPEGAVLVLGGEGGQLAGEQVPSFCVDITEVTVEAYRRCVDDGACLHSGFGNLYVEGGERLPINYVTNEDAENFCAFAGGRLPSKLEWWWVATNGVYATDEPWGEQSAAPFSLDCDDGSCDVGAFPRGDNFAGVTDLATSVAEFVFDEAAQSYSVMRVGQTFRPAVDVWACPRFSDTRADWVGFRCVYDR